MLLEDKYKKSYIYYFNLKLHLFILDYNNKITKNITKINKMFTV